MSVGLKRIVNFALKKKNDEWHKKMKEMRIEKDEQ